MTAGEASFFLFNPILTCEVEPFNGQPFSGVVSLQGVKKKKKRTVFANIFPFDFFPLLEKGYILRPFQVPFRSCWAPGWSFWENQTWLLSIENFCRLSWGLPRAQQCDSSASVEEPRTMHCFRLDIRSCDGGGLMSSVPASIACCVIWGRHLFSYLPFLICKMGKYQCLHQAKY